MNTYVDENNNTLSNIHNIINDVNSNSNNLNEIKYNFSGGKQIAKYIKTRKL